jgi:hypothetical protein
MNKTKQISMYLDIGELYLELKMYHRLNKDEILSALYPRICEYHGVEV